MKNGNLRMLFQVIKMYEVVENIASKDLYDYITHELNYDWSWSLCKDELNESTHYRKEEEDRVISDSGALLRSFESNRSVEENNFYLKLNTWADFIFHSVLKKTTATFKGVTIKRYYWNYYNTGSSGIFHQDYYLDTVEPDGSVLKHTTILLNLSDNGGTILIDNNNEVFIPSISGVAVIFNSDLRHRGIGPQQGKRFALNIVFTHK
jgi:hypothetical protein